MNKNNERPADEPTNEQGDGATEIPKMKDNELIDPSKSVPANTSRTDGGSVKRAKSTQLMLLKDQPTDRLPRSKRFMPASTHLGMGLFRKYGLLCTFNPDVFPGKAAISEILYSPKEIENKAAEADDEIVKSKSHDKVRDFEQHAKQFDFSVLGEEVLTHGGDPMVVALFFQALLEKVVLMSLATGRDWAKKLWPSLEGPQEGASTGRAPQVASILERIAFEASETAHVISEWQTEEQMSAGARVEYCYAERSPEFTATLDKIAKFAHDKNIKKASVRVPAATLRVANDVEREQYTLIIPEQRARALRKLPEWKKYRNDLVEFYGTDGYLPKCYVGKYDDIVIIADSYYSYSEYHSGKEIWRALLLGANAIEIGYRKIDIRAYITEQVEGGKDPSQSSMIVPFTYTIVGANTPKHFQGSCQYLMLFRKPVIVPQLDAGSGQLIRDKGLVVVELCDDDPVTTS